MGRDHRLDPEHGIHHVYSRGTRRWTLFIDELDYRRFMMRLGIVCLRYNVRVYAYCLMGNHFHLVVYCPSGQLSAAMRDLKSLYALQHNERHGFSGPLFESRFGSKLLTSHEYLQTLVRYVHRNPVAVNPSVPLESYSWSSHRFYLDDSIPRPDWLDIGFPRSLFGNADEYRHFVERNLESDKAILATASAPEGASRIDLPTRPSLSDILLSVAANSGSDLPDIRPRARNGLIGLVALVGCDWAGYTAAELCDPCGFASPQSLRNAKSAARARIAVDPQLKSVHDQTLVRLRLRR